MVEESYGIPVVEVVTDDVVVADDSDDVDDDVVVVVTLVDEIELRIVIGSVDGTSKKRFDLDNSRRFFYMLS